MMDFNRERSSFADQLNTIVNAIDQDLESMASPNRLCSQFLIQMMSVLEAERGFIMLFDSTLGEMETYATVNIDPDSLLVTEPFSLTLLEKVLSSGRSIIVYDALDDSRFADKTSVVLSGLRSIICVPILMGEGLLGTIYADNRTKKNVFKEEHSQFIKECTLKITERIMKYFPQFEPKPFNHSNHRLRELW
jgi:GAF domain-containing protein